MRVQSIPCAIAFVMGAGLLSGCAATEDSHELAAVDDPGSEPVVSVWPVDSMFVGQTAGDCPVLCYVYPVRTWYFLPNESLSQVHLLIAIDPQPDLEWEIVARLACRHEEAECPELPEVRGPSPLALDLDQLSLPYGLGLDLYIVLEGPAQVAGAATDVAYNWQHLVLDNWPHLTGNLTVLRDRAPPADESHWTLREITESYDGNTGQCLDVGSTECCCVPSGTERTFGTFEGRLLSVHLTVNWTPVSPATEELDLWFDCQDDLESCNRGDSEQNVIQKRSESPLVFDLVGPRWPPGTPFSILMLEGTTRTLVPIFTHQPYHVDVTYTILADPDGNRGIRDG